MNRKRLILYAAFGIYQVAAFIFTILVDGHLDLLGLLKYIPTFKYLTFIGLVLVIVDFTWYWLDHRANKKEKAALTEENDKLKVKLYDYQESDKGKNHE